MNPHRTNPEPTPKIMETTPNPDPQAPDQGRPHAWTFLTNHTHILLCLARDPTLRIRDIAELVGITQRAVQRILVELEDAGVLSHSRDGRRNHYHCNLDRPLRHPLESSHTLRELITPLLNKPETEGGHVE